MTQYQAFGNGAPRANAVCDLRSDTVTRPDPGMRQAIANAEVGDDVYGEDPTVRRLEEVVAERLNCEAALFFPTATQCNLSAVMLHCRRGDAVLCGESYHLIADEAAGASVLAGVALQPVPVADDGGLDPVEINTRVKPDDPHWPVSRMLSLENTVSGRAVPLERMSAAASAARENGLSVHLDGARFFNATTELALRPADLAGVADTVTLCLSKGLGAPIGAVLGCSRDMRHGAVRARKILGGSMRQSGVMAAAALYALDHNIETMRADHDNASRLARGLSALGVGTVRHATNMVHFAAPQGTHDALRGFLAERGILIGAGSTVIRMVTHRDINPDQIASTVAAMQEFFEQELTSESNVM